jgi:hypothetical protein
MIRLFTALCKTNLHKLTDVLAFQNATDSFNHFDTRCPGCGASGKLSEYGSYTRCLVSYEAGNVIDRQIKPLRFMCSSCHTTHALLPDIVVPHSTYSFSFKLAALTAYFERKTTVVSICECFGIAVSTIYIWKDLFLSHKMLFLGALANQTTPALVFLYEKLGITHFSTTLQLFFRKHAFSFLQGLPTPATLFIPP